MAKLSNIGNGDHASHNPLVNHSRNRSLTPCSSLGGSAQMDRFSKGCDRVIQLGRRAMAENARSSFLQTEKARQDELRDATQEAHRMMNAAHLRQAENKTKSDQYGSQMLLAMQEHVKSSIEAEYKAEVLAKCEANEKLYLAQWKEYKMKLIQKQLTSELRPVVEAELSRDSALRVDQQVRLELRDELRQEVFESLKAEHKGEVLKLLHRELRDVVIAEIRRDQETVVIGNLRSELYEKIHAEMRVQMNASPDCAGKLCDAPFQDQGNGCSESSRHGSREQSGRCLSNECEGHASNGSYQARSSHFREVTHDELKEKHTFSGTNRTSSASPPKFAILEDGAIKANCAMIDLVTNADPTQTDVLNNDCAIDEPTNGIRRFEDGEPPLECASIASIAGALESEGEVAERGHTLNEPVVGTLDCETTDSTSVLASKDLQPNIMDRNDIAKVGKMSGYESGDEETGVVDNTTSVDDTATYGLCDIENVHPWESPHSQEFASQETSTFRSSGQKRFIEDVDHGDGQRDPSAKRFCNDNGASDCPEPGTHASKSDDPTVRVKVELSDSQQDSIQDAHINPSAISLLNGSSEDEDESGGEESYDEDEEACDEEFFEEEIHEAIGFQGMNPRGEGNLPVNGDFSDEEDPDDYEESLGDEVDGEDSEVSEEETDNGGDQSGSRAAKTVIKNVNTQDTAWNIDDSDSEQDQTLVEDESFDSINSGKDLHYDREIDGERRAEGIVCT